MLSPCISTASANPTLFPGSHKRMHSVTVEAAAALAALVGCQGSQAPALGADSLPRTPVKLAPARTTDIEEATEYVATLKSLRSTSIQPQIDGQITKIYVKSWDRVEEGAPLVKERVRNPQGSLRGAQFVGAGIIWKTTRGLVIPVTSVLRLNGQFFAFVAEGSDGKLVARQRPIKVGPIVGDAYAVVDGIQPSERVVVSGAQKLTDNAPIAPQS